MPTATNNIQTVSEATTLINKVEAKIQSTTGANRSAWIDFMFDCQALREEIGRNEIEANGFLKYKASIVIPSHSGWFTDKQGLCCAESLNELLRALDGLMVNIDYDNDIKASKALLGAFKSFAA